MVGGTEDSEECVSGNEVGVEGERRAYRPRF